LATFVHIHIHKKTKNNKVPVPWRGCRKTIFSSKYHLLLLKKHSKTPEKNTFLDDFLRNFTFSTNSGRHGAMSNFGAKETSSYFPAFFTLNSSFFAFSGYGT
jgi:hypothetical protein